MDKKGEADVSPFFVCELPVHDRPESYKRQSCWRKIIFLYLIDIESIL